MTKIARRIYRTDFNPRAPYGARPSKDTTGKIQIKFQSTRPIRGATLRNKSLSYGAKNFNPRAPYGARPSAVSRLSPVSRISIHAPHTGRDRKTAQKITDMRRISIHAPHTGRDSVSGLMYTDSGTFQSTRPIRGATPTTTREMPRTSGFQSTRPIRGATTECKPVSDICNNFNPRAPYGARPQDSLDVIGTYTISIHAPHTGRDSY